MSDLLHRTIAEDEERDSFLHAVLGLVSLGGAVDRALAADGADAPAGDEPPASTVAGDDPALLAALGVVALRERLRAVLALADRHPALPDASDTHDTHDAPRPAATAGPGAGERGLLR